MDDLPPSSGLEPASAEGAGPFQLRVGTAPVNWNNFDLPGWRPVVPFPDVLDAMREAGYADTEWDQSFGVNPAELNMARLERDMTYMGAYRWLDFIESEQFAIDLDTLRPFLATLQAIGASHLIVADRLRLERVACAGIVPVDGSLSLDAAGYRTMADNLARLADVASRSGLSVHYHNHAGTLIETPSEVERLAACLDAGGVDLCLDTGHYAYGGGDALTFLRAHLSNIGYLHLKDVDERVLADAKANGWSFQDALRHYIFCPLGEGSARVSEIVGELVQHRFDGWVIVEQDTCRGDSNVTARANLEAVRGFERLRQPARRTSA